MAFGSIILLLIGAIIGYFYGSRIKPNKELQETLQEIKTKGQALLEEGKKGVYKTIVTDNQNSSELVVEVKEQAVTTGGQVKVQYLSAHYKNPDFRTRKGEALLQEVQGLLGEYLPQHEIEWYDTHERQENLREFLTALDATQTHNRQRK